MVLLPILTVPVNVDTPEAVNPAILITGFPVKLFAFVEIPVLVAYPASVDTPATVE